MIWVCNERQTDLGDLGLHMGKQTDLVIWVCNEKQTDLGDLGLHMGKQTDLVIWVCKENSKQTVLGDLGLQRNLGLTTSEKIGLLCCKQ